jgi:ubiquinol-cytochrome c reductase cytochrome b subunit
MSFWGATVITNILGAIPLIGPEIQVWIRGGAAIDQPTLNRFFSLHYLLPFVIAAVVILHIWALHIPGSSNPTGVDVKDEKDTLPFHPFYTAKDGWFAAAVLLFYAVVTYYAPNYLGHPDNYIPANPLATPAHIVPEWYFWPFYAILRAFTVDYILPAKLWGVLAMFASILLLFFLPWLDKSPVRSGSYRPMFRIFFWIWIVDILVLGICGGKPAEEPWVMLSQVATAYYFAFFLIILPILSMVERTKPLPNSISESVLHGEAAEAAPADLTGATPAQA